MLQRGMGRRMQATLGSAGHLRGMCEWMALNATYPKLEQAT
jgi:hypothetical protein